MKEKNKPTPIIDQILKEEVEIEHLEDGGFASVFLIKKFPDLIFKKSLCQSDGFRLLAKLSDKQREKFNFRKIIESKKVGDEYLYVLENLQEIDFSNREKVDLVMMFEGNELRYEDKLYSPRLENIKKMSLSMLKVLGKKMDYCSLDIHYSNIMTDEKGNIFLTDPISECER